jgi:pyruvate carboxylase subunit B
MADMEVDELVIKDTSGLLSPQATWELVTALKETVRLPIVVHSHCASGMAPMAYMAAVEAGASVLDTALSPLAWGASQPATESVVAALAGGDYDTGLDLEQLAEVTLELEALKQRNLQHLSPVADRVDSDILRFRMPGLMLEDIHRQLTQHKAMERLGEVLEEVTEVRKELGYPPLVAPLRQMIASQAVYNVIAGGRYTTVTQELKDYLQGLYGTPPIPADPEVRRLVLGREEPITIRPADLLEPQVEAARSQLRKLGFPSGDGEVLIYLLFPALARKLFEGPAEPATEAAATNGSRPVAEVNPEPAESGGGEPQAEAPSFPPPAPTVAEFDVEVDGEVFKVRVSGAGMSVAPAPPAGPTPAAETARAAPRAGAVVAPMQGLIIKVPVKAGDEVKLGDVVAVLEAMKMQNDIVSTVAGKVSEIYVSEGEVVGPNQPLVAIT